MSFRLSVRSDVLAPLGAAVLLLGVFAGCASTVPKPAEPIPALPLIVVEGNSLPVISFEKIVVDLPPQRGVGYHYVGPEYTRQQEYRWDQHFEDETVLLNDRSRNLLSEAGYRVASAGQGKWHLVGSVGPLSYNSYERKTRVFDQAECTVTWQLYRQDADKPDFVSKTKGMGRVADHKPGAIAAAYEVALRNLLGSPDFVATVGGRAGLE